MSLAFFDLDGTLFDRATSFKTSLVQFAQELQLDPGEFVPFVIEADNDGTSGWFHWMEMAKERFGFPGAIETLISEQRDRYLSVIPRERDSIEGLRQLRELGWTTVIITNGSTSQLETARKCGVLDAVDAFIMSGVVGVRKPDPKIFEIAAESVNLSLDTHTTWMVGDNPRADIGGARGVHINSIWLSRGRVWPLADFDPDESVGAIADAFSVIAGASRG